ncbi:MAG: carboxypeptidase regulatory-like domain-containing protein, partial [Acidobacteria bacterium]|nr:carboxypeptidase regulatory-like domain-containing protein [Acidobacteriota bacterium]
MRFIKAAFLRTSRTVGPRIAACSLLILSHAAVTAFGQNWRGAISGAVNDSAGRPVDGAQVALVRLETGKRHTALTGAQGEFVFSQLAPGAYRLEAEREGFRKHVQTLTLLVNQEIRLELSMVAGARTESIEVTARREPLKTESASLGAVIENRQVRNLPLDGRNFFELSLLVPGAVPAAQGSAGSVRGDFAIHLNGAREDANLFLLDGVYNGDPKLNGFAVNPPLDGIQEFEVLTSAYDASFGRNAGAQVNVVMKSGTNGVHGTGYEFFRNAALDARNFFSPSGEPKPGYQRNQ